MQTAKPSVASLWRTDQFNYLAIGLLKDQLLPNHKAPIPTRLLVVRGAIEFRIQGEVIRLQELDTYEIPVDIEHEVVGLEAENIFTLVQQK